MKYFWLILIAIVTCVFLFTYQLTDAFYVLCEKVIRIAGYTQIGNWILFKSILAFSFTLPILVLAITHKHKDQFSAKQFLSQLFITYGIALVLVILAFYSTSRFFILDREFIPDSKTFILPSLYYWNFILPICTIISTTAVHQFSKRFKKNTNSKEQLID